MIRWSNILLLALTLVASPAAAEEPSPHSEEGAEPAEYANSVAIRAALAVAFESEDSNKNRGEEVLGGFILSYERVIFEELMALEFALPLLMGKDGLEGPIDLTAKFFHRYGSWEPFLGAGITVSARFPWFVEEAEVEGSQEVFLGGTAGIGVVYMIRHGVGIEVAVEFNYFPADHRKFEVLPNTGFVVGF